MGKWAPLNDTPIAYPSSKLPTSHHSTLSARTLRKIATDPGPLGTIALEVLALFANLVNFKSARLGPSLDYITDKLCRSCRR